MLSTRASFVVAISLALACSCAMARAQGGAAPAATRDAEARRAYEAGAQAYDEGNFKDALAGFDRAYQLSPRPKLLFNIARAADGDAQLERALRAYRSYLLAEPRASNRAFVEARIAKLEGLVDALSARRHPAAVHAQGTRAPASSSSSSSSSTAAAPRLSDRGAGATTQPAPALAPHAGPSAGLLRPRWPLRATSRPRTQRPGCSRLAHASDTRRLTRARAMSETLKSTTRLPSA